MELIPAVIQDHTTGQILMLAFMNDAALRLTQETGYVHFWSRSRRRLWKKGEQSGHTLRLVELRLDCDNDCLLVRAQPDGPVCHTGHATCFFSDGDSGAPASVLDALYRVILDRKRGGGDDSYTRQLLEAKPPKIAGKLMEECGELCAELLHGPQERVVAESADLLYHLLVGLGAREIDPRAVFVELGRRFGVSGISEKQARKGKGAAGRAIPPAKKPATKRKPRKKK